MPDPTKPDFSRVVEMAEGTWNSTEIALYTDRLTDEQQAEIRRILVDATAEYAAKVAEAWTLVLNSWKEA